MGKRRRTKKNTDLKKKGDGETTSIPTPSTSKRITRGSNYKTETKIGGENASKKMKSNDLSNPPGQIEAQGQGDGQLSMDHLPPEMLTNVLKCVDTQNLFKCRLVNRNWCAISSAILAKRPHLKIRFQLNSKNEFIWYDAQKGRRSLKEFLITMKQTKNNLYSRFTFSITENSSQSEVFHQKDFKEFLSDFASSNQRIKSLTFLCDDVVSMEKLQFFTGKLGDLLLNKVPCLEELTLYFPWSIEAPHLKLFLTPKQEGPETDIKTNQDPAQFQLANLKVLHFVNTMISHYPEIVRDLLSAAVNLSWLRARVNKYEDWHFLDTLGKLHLLREADIDIDHKFVSSIIIDKNPLPLPKLENLHLIMHLTPVTPAYESIFSRAIIFLGNLFESCKDTLKFLKVPPLGKVPNLQFPTFKNLRKLCISEFCLRKLFSKGRMFPPGIRSLDVFPAVTDLDLRVCFWSAAFPQDDSIPLLPSVTSLTLQDKEYETITAEGIYIVALMCPNLKKIKIKKQQADDGQIVVDEPPPKLNLFMVGSSIWTYMKQLESLQVDINVDEAVHSPAYLDSCFTGISVENCRRLYEITKTGKISRKQKLHHTIERLAVRDGPSILDMKDLKRLIINPYSGEKFLDKQEFFTKNLTWISQEYAFKHMPQLKLNED